jgi:hypothetical protein
MKNTIYVVVSNGSPESFSPKKLAGKDWPKIKSQNQITTIKTTVTPESADSVILSLVANTYDPCKDTELLNLKEEERRAYGCKYGGIFTIAQLSKASVFIVSTNDHKLIEVLASAFMKRPDYKEKCLLFLTNGAEGQQKYYFDIQNDRLGHDINVANGSILFAVQSDSNVTNALTSTTDFLKQQFIVGSSSRLEYKFNVIPRLPPFYGQSSKTTRAVIIDADSADNATIFLKPMGLKKSRPIYGSEGYSDKTVHPRVSSSTFMPSFIN